MEIMFTYIFHLKYCQNTNVLKAINILHYRYVLSKIISCRQNQENKLSLQIDSHIPTRLQLLHSGSPRNFSIINDRIDCLYIFIWVREGEFYSLASCQFQLKSPFSDLCMKNLNELEVTKMISMDEETFDVKPTGICAYRIMYVCMPVFVLLY